VTSIRIAVSKANILLKKMSNFVELLKLGCDADVHIRETNQNKLLEMREGYTIEFFQSCA
jgi:hypothetical protein